MSDLTNVNSLMVVRKVFSDKQPWCSVRTVLRVEATSLMLPLLATIVKEEEIQLRVKWEGYKGSSLMELLGHTEIVKEEQGTIRRAVGCALARGQNAIHIWPISQSSLTNTPQHKTLVNELVQKGGEQEMLVGTEEGSSCFK